MFIPRGRGGKVCAHFRSLPGKFRPPPLSKFVVGYLCDVCTEGLAQDKIELGMLLAYMNIILNRGIKLARREGRALKFQEW